MTPPLATILVDPAPQVGVASTVTVTRAGPEGEVPAPGLTVRFVHRDGVPGEHELAMGITDGQGRITWTPTEGGAGVIIAGTEQLVARIDRPLPPEIAVHGAVLVLVAVAAGWLARRLA